MHRGDFAPEHTLLAVQKYQARAKIMPRENMRESARERKEGCEHVI